MPINAHWINTLHHSILLPWVRRGSRGEISDVRIFVRNWNKTSAVASTAAWSAAWSVGLSADEPFVVPSRPATICARCSCQTGKVTPVAKEPLTYRPAFAPTRQASLRSAAGFVRASPEGYISFRPFHPAHICAVEIRPVRKFILRPAFFRSEFSDALSEDFVEGGGLPWQEDDEEQGGRNSATPYE